MSLLGHLTKAIELLFVVGIVIWRSLSSAVNGTPRHAGLIVYLWKKKHFISFNKYLNVSQLYFSLRFGSINVFWNLKFWNLEMKYQAPQAEWNTLLSLLITFRNAKFHNVLIKVIILITHSCKKFFVHSGTLHIFIYPAGPAPHSAQAVAHQHGESRSALSLEYGVHWPAHNTPCGNLSRSSITRRLAYFPSSFIWALAFFC